MLRKYYNVDVSILERKDTVAIVISKTSEDPKLREKIEEILLEKTQK